MNIKKIKFPFFYFLILFISKIFSLKIYQSKTYISNLRTIKLNNIKDLKMNDIDSVSGINCSKNNCAGTCTTSTKCICYIGYVNFPNNYSYKFCSYIQKKQIKAFLLETFLPFGIGHFYLGRFYFGFIKMIFSFIPFFIFIFSIFRIIINKKFKSKFSNSFIFPIIIFSIINFIWWITDIINFSLNRYADGNGIPLLEW